MARISLGDRLQNFPFQLLDAGVSLAAALPVFTPGSSFSTVSSPELTLETEDIPEGNAMFAKKVIKRGSVSNITLTRGATSYDSDFYRWIMTALTGRPTFFSKGSVSIGGATSRRTLILVHFFRHSPLPRSATAIAGAAAAAVAGGASNFGIEDGGAQGALLSTANLLGGLFGGAALDAATDAPYTYAVRLPARAWVLEGCLPVRYKAGGDFDAMSGDVSVMELEIAVEGFREYSLSSAPIP